MKVVINNCYGGFGLSELAKQRYKELTSKELSNSIERNCPILIQVVEELGSEANSSYAELKIVEIPNDVNWYIEEYDGQKWVTEVHRTWS